ncbi:MAG: DNA repair protein RecN [Planctomycetota bacterium]
MLAHLTIRDLATLAHVELELPPGLVVFTGETGAGKSMLVESLRFALGDRGRGQLVREGAERAEVVVEFRLPAAHPLRTVLAADELADPDEPDRLLLRRIVRPGGRSVCQLNGVTVPLRVLQPLRPLLVDLTNQHEHVRLLDPQTHREVVDSRPAVAGHLAAYRAQYAAWRAAVAAADELEERARTRAERVAWLDHLLAEAEAVAPEPDEEPDLEARWKRNCHAEELRETASALHTTLVGEESAESRLDAAASLVRKIARLDAVGGAALSAQLETVLVSLQECAAAVEQFGGDIETDAAAREAMEDRLDDLRRLRRQFACDASELTARIAACREERDVLGEVGTRTEAARAAATAAREALQTLGEQLADARAQAVPGLIRDVEQRLKQLHMHQARLKVVWTPRAEPGPDGLHELRLHVQTNPGEGFHPLDRIASGGELSRMLLSIKPAMRGEDPVLTTVFDEVDSGIGGAAAVAVGELLHQLADGRQVLCVSHLPQVAAAADHHFHVTKQVSRGRTRTRVEQLVGKRRLEVLSTLLGGDATDAALAHAEELLSRSRGAS